MGFQSAIASLIYDQLHYRLPHPTSPVTTTVRCIVWRYPGSGLYRVPLWVAGWSRVLRNLSGAAASLAAACGSNTLPRADPPASGQRLRTGHPRVTAQTAGAALPRHPQIPAVGDCSLSGRRCCTTRESQKSTAQRRLCRTSLAGA